MAYETPELEGLLGTLTDDVTEEDRDAVIEQTEEDRYESGEYTEGDMSGQLQGVSPQDEDYRANLEEYMAGLSQEESEKRRREKYGLEGDEIFAYAERLYGIGQGDIKTEGQIEAEKELDILAKAQRGRAMGYGGFNSAELLQKAGRSAQQTELGGESAIDKAARQASMAARDQLEQLLISGRQRAEDKAFAMQQLAFQQEQASGSLWSNVLGGVLGAIGTVVGAVASGGNPAAAVAAGSAMSALGKGTGRYLG